jgi:hemerythrin superfamily protein
MAVQAHATGKTTPAPQSTDAVALLTADHEEVKQLFKQYEKLVDAQSSDDGKALLAQQICTRLTVHATTEEEILYPAARAALDDEELVDEATVEHASIKELITQILQSSPDDDLYDAKVKVLGEHVDHHVKEEEDELFPKLKEAGLDLDALGGKLSVRKQQLTSDADATEA